MALASLTPIPNQTKNQENNQPKKKKKKKQKLPSSWDQFKNLLTCKSIEPSRTHDPATSKTTMNVVNSSSNYSKLGNSCSSICSFKDVVHGNTRVVHRPDDNSPESSGSVGQEIGLLQRRKCGAGVSNGGGSSSDNRTGPSERSSTVRSSCGGALYASASSSSNSRRMPQLRKFSGCYECHMIVDPSRYPTPRTTICTCPKCGEVFPKIESLEHHQAVRHAVSELDPEDSGRNIVEIIFKSSWLKKDSPICKIERILKVHNTPKTIQRFEDCRDTVKLRATHNTKKNPRCAADGNELLRFQCTTLTCALGARGASNLCGSGPGCRVCTVIRNGFRGEPNGVRTMASSGKAHDCLGRTENGTRRAMLVCRVIAGRVRRVADDVTQEEEGSSAASYDSLAGYAGMYSDLEELIVFNPRAILPCFVVIYKALD